MDPDPTVEKIKSVQAATTFEQLIQVMWPADIAEGFATEDEIYNTIQKRLEDMVDGTRSHRELAEDSDFNMRLLMPRQTLSAVHTCAEKNGWHPESLMLCVISNLMWLENPATRLAQEPRPDGKGLLFQEADDLPMQSSPPKSTKRRRKGEVTPCRQHIQKASQSDIQTHALVTDDLLSVLDAVLSQLDAQGNLETATFKQIRLKLEEEAHMEKDALLPAKYALKSAIHERMGGASQLEPVASQGQPSQPAAAQASCGDSGQEPHEDAVAAEAPWPCDQFVFDGLVFFLLVE